MTVDPDLAAVLSRIPPGVRIGGEPADEAEHYITCPSCGQAVDMRDLAEVLRHDEAGHKGRRWLRSILPPSASRPGPAPQRAGANH